MDFVSIRNSSAADGVRERMRLAFSMVLVSVSAQAEPAPTEPVPAAPELHTPGTKSSGAVGVHDVWASGTVIAPPAHADKAEWPRGMVMTPPEASDRNVLGLGGLRLPDRAHDMALPAAGDWPRWLSRRLAHGIGGLLDWMNPVGL
ncbi:MAG: hypothetical protein SFX73_24865 [Kofleriaceae bacterium]|nr:hypothetical protein [Kofleriaceae bacterium]